MAETITEEQGNDIIYLLKCLLKEVEQLNEINAINGKMGPLKEIKNELEKLSLLNTSPKPRSKELATNSPLMRTVGKNNAPIKDKASPL
jgi:hypothetical protein